MNKVMDKKKIFIDNNLDIQRMFEGTIKVQKELSSSSELPSSSSSELSSSSIARSAM